VIHSQRKTQLNKTEREHPGQDIEYVVVNDKRSLRDRVALAHEDAGQYHPSDYGTELVRVVESIISPRSDIR
jgi:DNA polymerase I